MTDEAQETELETAILTVYQGPLDGFVSRRDALAKSLRSSGRRADADQVKALRKPSRAAWTLNSVAVEDSSQIERLVEAMTAAQEASRGGSDLRAALDQVRSVVRDVAAAAARVAVRAGHPIDSASLVSALSALIGDATAFGDLRAGRLVDIPDAGGLDLLSALAAAPPVRSSVGRAAQPESPDDEAIRSARAQLRQAEAALSEAREHSRSAERAVLDAQAKFDAAERQLQRAQDESAARRTELERSRELAKSAGSQLKAAEQAVAELQAGLKM